MAQRDRPDKRAHQGSADIVAATGQRAQMARRVLVVTVQSVHPVSLGLVGHQAQVGSAATQGLAVFQVIAESVGSVERHLSMLW